MKTNILQFLLILLSLNAYSQFDDTLSVEALTLPDKYLKIYYADSLPKLVNGIPYSGVDTSSFVEMGEKLFVQEIYKNGFKIELKTFYDNGNVCCHYQYKNGKRNGLNKRYYKNGNVMFDSEMKDGHIVGTEIMYFENGHPMSISNEKKFMIGFHDNGRVESLGIFLDSIKCGNSKGFEETQWDKDGRLILKQINNCGKQSFRFYYNDSTLYTDETIIDMPLFHVGRYRKFYKNGKLMIDGQYQDGETRDEANVKTGTWKYWNEKGELIKEEL